MEMDEENKNDLSIPFILRYCFKDIKQEDESNVNVSAVRNICSKVIKSSVTSTSKFLELLKRNGHPDMLEDHEKHKNSILKKRNTEISSGSESAVICKTLKQSTLTNINGSRSVNLDNLIVQFIVECMLPISIVEYDSFKVLTEGAQQLTMPPNVLCCRSIQNKFSDEYNEFKEKIKIALRTVEFVCSTADVWSSYKISYLGVKVHCIESEALERKSAFTAFRRFKGAQTYDTVAEIIADLHSECDLKLSKIVKTVTDNGSNMLKAFEVIGKSDSDSETLSNPEYILHDENLEITPLDEVNEEDDLTPESFPDASSELESDCLLPEHEICAMHTLKLIAILNKQD